MRRTQLPQGGGLPPLSMLISEACRMTGIGRSKLYELIKDGAVEVIKFGDHARADVVHPCAA